MNDNELLTIVRESVADVHSSTPVAQIVSRGRAMRAQRRTPAVAGAATMLAGAALAVTTLLPSSHPGSPLTNTRLDAWTVARQANGEIDVTIRQLLNPAGLQSRLRADGLPVNVSFSGHALTRSCQLYRTTGDVLNRVAHFPFGGNTGAGTVYLVIKPSALPTGAGLAMFVGSPDDISTPRSGAPGTVFALGEGRLFSTDDGHVRTMLWLTVSPVHASRQCTG